MNMYSGEEIENKRDLIGKDWSELESSKNWQIPPKEISTSEITVSDIKRSFMFFKSEKHVELELKLKEYSKDIVGLEDNWDDLGSKGFSIELWDRVVSLLRRTLYEIWNQMLDLQVPLVLPSPDGSFDIH